MSDSELNSLKNLSTSYEDQEQYNTVIFCSNIVKSTPFLIEREIKKNDDTYSWRPLIIRKGDIPKVWLSTLVKNRDGEDTFIDLVIESNSVHPEIIVESSVHGIRISLKASDETILELADHKPTRIEVIKLDLRPVSLNIFGDHTELKIVNNSFSRGSISNSRAFIGI